jgi:hypothetical protein
MSNFVDFDLNAATNGENEVRIIPITEHLVLPQNYWEILPLEQKQQIVSEQFQIEFPKDTPIVTDQGIVNIQDITNQTIYGLKVEYITQTTSIHKELVCFEKDSISIGYPNQRTIMTRNHKVFYGTMVNADTLLKDNIYLIPYNGEILYNVLLEKNGFMIVNNLLCETLDINNIIALFYKSNYTVEEKNKIMTLLNNNINNETYKEISYQYFSNILKMS